MRCTIPFHQFSEAERSLAWCNPKCIGTYSLFPLFSFFGRLRVPPRSVLRRFDDSITLFPSTSGHSRGAKQNYQVSYIQPWTVEKSSAPPRPNQHFPLIIWLVRIVSVNKFLIVLKGHPAKCRARPLTRSPVDRLN